MSFPFDIYGFVFASVFVFIFGIFFDIAKIIKLSLSYVCFFVCCWKQSKHIYGSGRKLKCLKCKFRTLKSALFIAKKSSASNNNTESIYKDFPKRERKKTIVKRKLWWGNNNLCIEMKWRGLFYSFDIKVLLLLLLLFSFFRFHTHKFWLTLYSHTSRAVLWA